MHCESLRSVRPPRGERAWVSHCSRLALPILTPLHGRTYLIHLYLHLCTWSNRCSTRSAVPPPQTVACQTPSSTRRTGCLKTISRIVFDPTVSWCALYEAGDDPRHGERPQGPQSLKRPPLAAKAVPVFAALNIDTCAPLPAGGASWHDGSSGRRAGRDPQNRSPCATPSISKGRQFRHRRVTISWTQLSHPCDSTYSIAVHLKCERSRQGAWVRVHRRVRGRLSDHGSTSSAQSVRRESGAILGQRQPGQGLAGRAMSAAGGARE